MHISSGMFGMILVEPKEGLPEVDHEFYFGQHELYTTGDTGEKGHHDFDMEAMAAEEPTYVLMNGEKYAITPDVHARPACRWVRQPGVLRDRRSEPRLQFPPHRLRLGRGLAAALSLGRRTSTSRPRRSSRGPVPSRPSTPRCLDPSNWSTTRSPGSPARA